MSSVPTGVRPLKVFFMALGTSGAAALALLMWASSRTGSLGAGFSYLMGDYVYAVSRGPIQVTDDSKNAEASTTVSFENLSNVPIRIVGYNNPCLCLAISGLPVLLGPRGQAELQVEARGRADEPRHVPVTFITDHPAQRMIRVEFVILPNTAPPAGNSPPGGKT